MNKWRLFCSIFLLLCSSFLFSKEEKLRSFKEELIKIANDYKNDLNFYKTAHFFIDGNGDSTLIYSAKQSDYNSNAPLVVHFKHYCRGYSFYGKNLLKEAEREFKLISPEFPFYYKVKLQLGNIALASYNYVLALKYYHELEILNSAKYDFKQSAVYHNIGICYLYLHDYAMAEKYLFKSAELQEQQKDSSLLIGTMMDMASLYSEQHMDQLAIPYFERAYKLSLKMKDNELKYFTAKNISVVEENRNNFPLALSYRKEMERWGDSLHDQEKVWSIADAEKKLAVQEKQKEVDLLAAENKIKAAQRNGLIGAAVLLIALLATGFYFYREKIKSSKIILAQKMELDELNATKDKLFSIVSHDLRSSVNALKTSNNKLIDCLHTKKLEELDKLLANNSIIANGAYNLLDNLLNWALLQTKQLYFQKDSLHLHSIVQQVTYNYQPLMLNKNITLEQQLDKTIFVFADQDSAKIILRNLLDNAIKFSEENGTIRIYTRLTKKDCYDLVIEDSGRGMTEATRLALLKESVLLSKKKSDADIGTGLGLQLCKSMIAKNGGSLAIESLENKGTKMIVSLPKSQNNG
jgi:signal transduction histidine kinase